MRSGNVAFVLDLDDDPRFRTNPTRVANRDALRATIEAALAGRSTHEWEQALVDAGIPAARVRTVAEAMDDPGTAALGILHAARRRRYRRPAAARRR